MARELLSDTSRLRAPTDRRASFRRVTKSKASLFRTPNPEPNVRKHPREHLFRWRRDLLRNPIQPYQLSHERLVFVRAGVAALCPRTLIGRQLGQLLRPLVERGRGPREVLCVPLESCLRSLDIA